jgi:hypothetical protein
MSKIIQLKDNPINRDDQHKLESFGGHTIARGRATRWHWTDDDTHEAVFEIFRGGSQEELIARVYRDREHDMFTASDQSGYSISAGSLDHVMAQLENYFISIHGE